MSNQNSSISSFSAFLLRILLPLVLLLFVAGYLFTYFFEQKIILGSPTCGAYKVHRIISELHPDEIPIFGSSRALNGFVPDSLGPTFFNYGLSGTKYDVTLFFMEQECKKKKNNPWMLINLDFESFHPGLGDVSNYLCNISDPSVRALVGNHYKPNYGIYVVKYYGQYVDFLKDYLSDRVNVTKIADKGALLEKNVLREDQFAKLVQQRERTDNSFTMDTSLLNKMVRLIDSHPDRTFVFVVSPYHKSYFNRFGNIGQADSFLAQLGRIPNVRILDFSRQVYPDSMFLNTTHLIYTGAYKFSHDLRDSLSKMMRPELLVK